MAVQRRPLRVIHIGNIANYAYNIGKVLQTGTVQSDVISWDYYHINARPVWEEGDFDASSAGDQFFPALPGRAETGFEPPDWYWHGPRRLAALGLIARNEGKRALSAALRGLNERALRKIADPAYRERNQSGGPMRAAAVLAEDWLGRPGGAEWPRHASRALSETRWGGGLGKMIERLGGRPSPDAENAENQEHAFDARAGQLLAQFAETWPDRAIDPVLLMQFKGDLALMQRLFKPYDAIIGYATDGIWPLMAGRPYLAYEFGTIRNLPFEDSAMGKLASVVYRNSDLTIVTNSDNEAPAKRLARPYAFLPHIINESLGTRPAEDVRAELEARHGGAFYVFHPPRQHWDGTRNTNWDKGNDKFFRAFAALVHQRGIDARCVAVNWGATLDQSKALIASLGLRQNIVWIEPQPHRRMMSYIAAVDAIADQFTIPTFGGIPPKAFFAGKPVVTSFDPALHRWCFANPPPLLAASEPADIEAALFKLASDPGFAKDLAARAGQWYLAENSNARIREILTGIVSEHVQRRAGRAAQP